MITEKRVKYFFTNIFLIWAMSAYEYLLDSYTGMLHHDYAVLYHRYSKGYTRMNSLGGWLARDVHWHLIKPRTEDEKEAQKIIDKYESLQSMFLEWAERLRTKAQQICQIKPDLVEAVVVYYFACGWLLRILAEANDFVRALSSTEMSDRFRVGHKYLNKVAKHLKEELHTIREDITNPKDAELIISEIGKISNELAKEWREQLHASANQHLSATPQVYDQV